MAQNGSAAEVKESTGATAQSSPSPQNPPAAQRAAQSQSAARSPAATQSPPAAHDNEVLEVDDASADADSAYNASIGSSSYVSSLTSSIRNYKYENGRRYHAYHEGSYVLPNDDEEQDRMDLLNHIYRLTLGGNLHLAPIGPNPQRVLDIGTGTGIWAIQFAEEYPSAEVIGTDLSPIQPQWVPPNCVFEVDDFEQEWLFRTEFDYIHGRELNGFVTDYDRLFRRAFNHLKPGGYFEMQSVDAYFFADDETIHKAKYCQMWAQYVREASEKFGKSFTQLPTWKEKMEKAGFVDVRDVAYKIPEGRWPKNPRLKEIGKYQQAQQIQATEAYTYALFSRILGWETKEIEMLCAHVRNELLDPTLHLYVSAHFVYGRKP
ncbi:hypothetical protein VTN00DRAFT_3211 [Thermoascus crustaceus]|uniref:uncharacterized protein n=1 Tax=Thermoascus crustaceus TaxID=5088 RepID=UPI003743B317